MDSGRRQTTSGVPTEGAYYYIAHARFLLLGHHRPEIDTVASVRHVFAQEAQKRWHEIVLLRKAVGHRASVCFVRVTDDEWRTSDLDSATVAAFVNLRLFAHHTAMIRREHDYRFVFQTKPIQSIYHAAAPLVNVAALACVLCFYSCELFVGVIVSLGTCPDRFYSVIVC